MAKPKSAKLLCTPNVFERCFLNQGHLAQVPVRLYIRKVHGEGGAEVSATISNPAYNPNAEIPQQGTGRRTNKKIKGALKSIAKAGKVASLATLAAGQPEIAAPLGAVSEAIDQISSTRARRCALPARVCHRDALARLLAPARARWRWPLAKIQTELAGKWLSLVARASPRLENAAGGAQKISESAARVSVAAQCVWNAHRRREGRDHN